MAEVFWSLCFDTVEMACPRLLVTSLMIQTERLWTGQVVVIIMARAGGTVGSYSKVFCIQSGEKQKDYCGCEVWRDHSCGLPADAVLCVCLSQNYHYLENLQASADDSTGHMVKVIARWQLNAILNTE